MYRFPASDLDRPNTLLGVVGSFWSDLYTGSHLVRSFLYARAQLDVQTHADLLELTAAMSRFKTPVFHVDNWHLLTLRRSERNQTSLNLAKSDGSYAYDGSIAYDVPLTSTHSYWTAPAELKHASLIFNRISDPSLTLVAGLDFVLMDGVLVFFSDPFDNELVPQHDGVIDGVDDATINLWLYHSEFDRQTMYKQFGYIMGVNKPSSQIYKDFVNALFDEFEQEMELVGPGGDFEPAFRCQSAPLPILEFELEDVATLQEAAALDDPHREVHPVARTIGRANAAVFGLAHPGGEREAGRGRRPSGPGSGAAPRPSRRRTSSGRPAGRRRRRCAAAAAAARAPPASG